jgi:dipeptidyl aminopeptidase/acylaminoacyl peptidase
MNMIDLAEDGVMIEGLLFYPLDYRKGQRYPHVVKTHDGPAAKGYAMFSPNFRGG